MKQSSQASWASQFAISLPVCASASRHRLAVLEVTRTQPASQPRTTCAVAAGDNSARAAPGCRMSTDEMAGRAAESGQLRGSTAVGAQGGGQPAGEDDDGEAEEVPDWLSFAKFAKCVLAFGLDGVVVLLLQAAVPELTHLSLAELWEAKAMAARQEIPSSPNAARRTLSPPPKTAMSICRPRCSMPRALRFSRPSHRAPDTTARAHTIGPCGTQA